MRNAVDFGRTRTSGVDSPEWMGWEIDTDARLYSTGWLLGGSIWLIFDGDVHFEKRFKGKEIDFPFT